MALPYPEPERIPEEPLADEPAPSDATFIGHSPFSEPTEESVEPEPPLYMPSSEPIADEEPFITPPPSDPTFIGQSPFSEPAASEEPLFTPPPSDPTPVGEFSYREPFAAEPPPYTPPPSQPGPAGGPPPGGFPPYGAPAAPLSPSEERTWAMLAHLSTLANLFTGFLGPIAALIIYLIYKDRSRYVALHAMQSFVFQLVFWVGGGVLAAILWTVGGILSVVLIGLCIFPFALIASFIPLVAVAYGVYAAIKAYNGEAFDYPLVANWVRNV